MKLLEQTISSYSLGAPDYYTAPLDIAGSNGVDFLHMDDEQVSAYLSHYPVSTQVMQQLMIHYIISEDLSSLSEWKVDYYIDFAQALGKHLRIISSDKERFAQADPIDICVVCMENQGRSQIKERLIRAFAGIFGLKVNLRSRGYKATPEKHNGAPGPILKAKMRAKKVPIDDATVDQFTEIDVNKDTILIVMDKSIELHGWAYKAKYVLNNYIEDPFPGSKIATDGKVLDNLIFDVTESALELVFTLTGVVLSGDWKYFEKKFAHSIDRLP